jgi:hypothetical protein
MKPASLNEIKKELNTLDADTLQQICLKLGRYKKENKELLTYLLFEAQHEPAYVSGIQAEIDQMFQTLPTGNVYYIKKTLRKIIRYVNRQTKYSGVPATELEVRIYLCQQIRAARVPLREGTVLYNMYRQQVNKIQQIISKLPEDLQFDYASEIKIL